MVPLPWIQTGCNTCDLRYARHAHQSANLVVNIRSPEPTTNPIGTIHQPSTSLLPTGETPRTRGERRSPGCRTPSGKTHSPAVTADEKVSTEHTERARPLRSTPRMDPSKTKNPATLRLAQRNKLSSICTGDRLTSARANRLSVRYSLASSSGQLPSATSAASNSRCSHFSTRARLVPGCGSEALRGSRGHPRR